LCCPNLFEFALQSCNVSALAFACAHLLQVVPVRPFKHDEYERFLLAAYPYYAGAASTMAAFLLVGLAVLYTK
jgi:oligosaccharyltransferase complex subunit beta